MYTCINSFAAILNGLHQEKKIHQTEWLVMCMFYKFDALKFIYRNEIDIGTLFKFLLTVYGLSVYIWSKLSCMLV